MRRSASIIGITSLLASLCIISACSVLPKPEPVAMDQYVLEYTPGRVAAGSIEDLPVLIVTTPRAHGGYDTHRIAYMKQEYGLRYFTRSRWADTPARMLAPLLADAIQATGQYQSLYAVPGSIAADYRLDTELIRFHQDFTQQPSVVRITLRAQLIDLRESRVVATKQADIIESATTDDSYGGVVAANKAIGQLLDELAQFSADQLNQETSD